LHVFAEYRPKNVIMIWHDFKRGTVLGREPAGRGQEKGEGIGKVNMIEEGCMRVCKYHNETTLCN
jgi:hypothetical protein